MAVVDGILKMRHHKKGSGTKHTGRRFYRSSHHENKSIKSQELSMRQAYSLKYDIEPIHINIPTPDLIDIDDDIKMAIQDKMEQIYQDSLSTIRESKPASEEESTNIIKETIQNSIFIKIDTAQPRQYSNPLHSQDKQIPINNFRNTTINESLVDSFINIVWEKHTEPHPQYLFEGTKCPRCHTGFIVSEFYSSVCINCGYSEDYETTHTMRKRHLIKWLIANRPNSYQPPKWMLLPKTCDELDTLHRRVINSTNQPY